MSVTLSVRMFLFAHTKNTNTNRKYKQVFKTFTYVWYWACKKLNSSLIRSNVSTMVNFRGPCGGGPYIIFGKVRSISKTSKSQSSKSNNAERDKEIKVGENKNKDGILEVNIWSEGKICSSFDFYINGWQSGKSRSMASSIWMCVEIECVWMYFYRLHVTYPRRRVPHRCRIHFFVIEDLNC